ncbi:MAG: transglutaminase domain-containing protein [Planctomycetaceae bacterium]|nr:transglutaminase domain-containing protein [Planctomycetaceae bacterium]
MLHFQSLTRSTRRQFVATSVVSVAGFRWAGRAGAQDSVDPSATTALQYQSPQIQNWRIGLVLDTPVTCTNVLATFVIPIDWPEQKVTVTGQQISPLVNAWKSRDLPTGARQIVLTMPRVPAGTTAEVTFTLQVERSRILGPDLTDGFVIPKRPSRDLRMFMGNSPFIDATDRRIKAASRDLAAVEVQSDWERVESIYDFVRENVEYVEGSLKNASDALKDGTGDCEEMTSLFVALCRNARIPARMVWIPDHCYPEFYLEDAEGNGHWFPCQAAGTRQFGRMDEYRPVLQKGDRFKVPEKKMPTRYLSEYFKCDKKGKGDPDPRFVREQIEI